MGRPSHPRAFGLEGVFFFLSSKRAKYGIPLRAALASWCIKLGMRTFAVILLALASCAARAQLVDHLVPFHSSAGVWEFGCRDGKLVAVRIVFIVPGEVLLPVPADICDTKVNQTHPGPPASLPAPPASSKSWKPA